MKFVTSLILIIFFSFFNTANSSDFYIKALKEAALSNGFQKPEEVNSLFDKEKSELGNKLFHDELLKQNFQNGGEEVVLGPQKGVIEKKTKKAY